nr:immunoglobulin light chain junction region [Macaca mulatta]MOW14069.1 immunoglobulin light chain junction region [Macaca mulatta]
CQSYINSPITF